MTDDYTADEEALDALTFGDDTGQSDSADSSSGLKGEGTARRIDLGQRR